MDGAVYWIGQDGNIWLKDSGGTRNVGPAGATVTRPDATGFYDPWADVAWGETPLRYNATQIADPMVQQTTSAPRADAPAQPALNQAAVDNTQRTINEIPGLLAAAIQAERTRHGNTVQEFNEQETGQRKTYEGSSTTNMKNYDSNFMDAIRAGIKGVGGLMALLRGTGAGGGTAEDMARDTVAGVTSNDIRTGADTRNENQTQLDSSLSTFLTDLGRKRRAGDETLVNNERAIHRESDTQLQDLFGKMAGYYSEAGRAGDATNWMNQAGNLTPIIAQNSRTQVSPYDTAPVTVQAPELNAFKSPTQPNVVTAPNGQVGSGIFTISENRRRREQAPVGV